MRRNLFWLTDDQWQQIGPLLPTDVRGMDRVDDRRVISHQRHPVCAEARLPMVRLSAGVGAHTTIYNRFVRWARRGMWEKLFRELV
jgi:transposase